MEPEFARRPNLVRCNREVSAVARRQVPRWQWETSACPDETLQTMSRPVAWMLEYQFDVGN
ncbi:MAG: hypothetical protein DWI29_02275 [Planctomycetota bacterium]|nr:MAG: hypothetical protein DWI29_02275 [Planctomycetota bacterium]